MFMTTLVFGHKSPDTDSTGSAIVWAWFLSHHEPGAAEARVLGTPNTEAQFVLKRWGFDVPPLLTDLPEGTPVVIVDTNNPAELPETINKADIQAIIDHHKLVGGLETKGPIEITVRPVACTATLLYQLMGGHAGHAPTGIKGLILSCILSDTLEFRSPTTTPVDRQVAERLAAELKIAIPEYAAEMFAAKSDVSAFSDAELLRMDSKEYNVSGTELRVSVLETTSPQTVLSRKDSLMASMVDVAKEDGADQVLLFVIDILREEATMLIPNDLTKKMAEASFGVTVTGDTVVIPGLMSRKKQIIPALKV
jgi:manganese-dependent inorganic pyrophosphatase